ncbi:MAG: hypothetical protein KC731_26185, partial [Myxococcales bacterium]|nr:hypothetical protein [Myxococcales bacterium]
VACNFAPDSCFGILVPEVEGQDYILVVERKGGSLAPDDAYSIFSGQVGVPVTASEPLDDGSNDSLVNAEVLAPLVLDNEPSYLFEGTLDDGDVDWWYVPTSEPDETLRLWCGSSYFGTGIEGLTLDAYKDDATDGAPVQSETETAQRRIHWWGAHAKGTSLLPPLPGGTGYYFKLSSSSFSSIVTSRHYYCQIIHHSTAN